ncbi:hypothetical protein BOX15_Mlig021069g1 [Macrostomum lignano]|uniref:Heparan-sulfate 6-O-sulfotransferase n=1 Tax=Macrostomum lignano TaxID=282301 RepID=A0A267FMT2_9PLAT|nr:hypothetical protein BOX15_Mlig021069g1 [Macrostomum lignano]
MTAISRNRLCLAAFAVVLLVCCFLLLSRRHGGSRHLVAGLFNRRWLSSANVDTDPDDLDWPPRPPPDLMQGGSALVLVHIQKTGGSSLNRQFVRAGVRGLPCRCRRGRKRCLCLNSADTDWLFSRGSVGWRCGLHASLAALQACVPNWHRFRPGVRLHYMTVLRRPVDRFFSEWRHVRRGATWEAARRFCDGKPMDPQPELCYRGDDWHGVGLAEFAGCATNPAINRQSRMLANLTGRECLGGKEMLAGALANLRRMIFVGLTEYQVLNQYQLTRGLGLLFNRLFWQHDETVASQLNTSRADLAIAESATSLDARLYAAAERLFFHRTRRLLIGDAIAARADPGLAAAIAGLDTAGLRAVAPRMAAAAGVVLRRLGARGVSAAERRRVRQKVKRKLIQSQ